MNYFYGFHPIWIIGMLMCLAIPIAVIVGAVLLMRQRPPQAGTYTTGAPPPPLPPAPLGSQGARDILDRRFASGEITAEEYRKARDLLEGRPPAAG